MVTGMREMKDSGIEWIGEIPKNWKSLKLQYACDTITDYTASGSFADLAANVVYRDDEDYAMLVRTADLSAKREMGRVYVDKHAYDYLHNSNLFGGEIILPNVGSVGTVYYYSPLYKKATLAPNAIMLRTVNNRYLYYLFLTKPAEEALNRLSNATTQAKFNKTQLRKMKVVLPSLAEQDIIVSYLDSKCAEIDALSADIQSEIDTLEAYKRSVITEAVTKGLDKSAPMKDSGIDYVGIIPVSWSIKRLKYILEERNYRSETGLETLLSVSQYFGVVPSYSIQRTMQAKSLVGYKKVYPKDLVFNKLNPVLARFGVSAHTGITSPDFAVYYTDKADTRFLCYLLKTDAYIMEYGRLCTGVGDGFSRLYTPMLYNIKIAVPSLKEQCIIADYLDSTCAEIDAIIAQKQEQLAVLADYKKSIIYEYVTGKKEVPMA